ncbi:uncharacterized protein PAE49_018480 [Odontesthes bonariensis]|uniref:uncharacterized protein LOC142402105 n=1 Tax=Odontesthes bonariensis TaxID=219752 RepID=UPI003F581B55
MAGNALGIVSCLLLLASIIQGLRDVELIHLETLEVVAGENITLPCIVKDVYDLKIISMEWRKDGGTKLAVTSPEFGQNKFWPNVTIQNVKHGKKTLIGSYLHLPEAGKWDSGIYSCEITTFPFGSIKNETKVTVKDDIKIVCDAAETVEVHYGENTTIRCTAFPDAQYKWTKDNKTVSENESLELWRVTAAHAGVYKLTVNAGDQSLHKDFIISVLTATTSLRADPATVSPQAPTESAHSSFTTSLTTGLATDVNWTARPNASDVAVTDAGHLTSSTVLPTISVPSSPATHSDTYHSLSSTASSTDVTAVFKSTPKMSRNETRNESKIHTMQPEDIFSVSTEESSTVGSISQNSEHPDALPTGTVRTTVFVTENKGTERSHLLPVVIIIIMLLLIAVVGFFCRRLIMKKRMDLPPSFKPPPPPIKYSAARQSDTFTQTYPTSRCNSIVETKEMRPIFIKI